MITIRAESMDDVQIGLEAFDLFNNCKRAFEAAEANLKTYNALMRKIKELDLEEKFNQYMEEQ